MDIKSLFLNMCCYQLIHIQNCDVACSTRIVAKVKDRVMLDALKRLGHRFFFSISRKYVLWGFQSNNYLMTFKTNKS